MSRNTEAGTNPVSDFDKLTSICGQRLEEFISSGRISAQPEEYRKRLEYELTCYSKAGYASLILITADYIDWARKNNVVVGPGRGSAAGSLVVFLSGITTIDPLRFGLIFERFLNPERISLPDIDSDFSDRDAVINYLRSKYGQNRVAKVGVPSLYKPRSTIDELAQLSHLDFGEAKRITKLIGDARTFDEAFKAAPELATYEGKYPELFRDARALQGFVRQTTTHPSAVILTQEPIGTLIPMQRMSGEAAATGQLITGWDGEELDSLGYVKLDILTVDNLSIIMETIGMLEEKIDFYNLPLDDQHTLRGFELGETVAVFQLEEPKTVGILKGISNITFEDIAATNALIRPGLDVSKFIKSRNSGQVEYLIPELEPILGTTFGVILYQEQVMRMCTDLAGFSMTKADKVRKIIAKTANQRAVDGLKPVYEDFKKGYLERGLDADKFEQLWASILACQNYIFNRSHAICYGYIAYADMFLKRHYPLQFMCAALNVRSKELYIKECDRLGIKVLPPDVNKSGIGYTIEGDSIRMGLSCIKHIGAKANAIVERRPYSDEFECLSRIKPNQKQTEALVFSGAFDCFGDRGNLATHICKESFQDTVDLGQLSTQEKEIIGFYLVYNPLKDFEKELKKCVTPETPQPASGLIGGMIAKLKEHQAKTGPMAFISLLTDGGEMEIVVWPSDYQTAKPKLKIGNVIVANGKKTDKGNYSVKDIVVLRERK